MIPSTESTQHTGNSKYGECTAPKTEDYHILKLRIADAAEIVVALLLMALCAVLVPREQCGAGLSFLMLMGTGYLVAGVKLGLEHYVAKKLLLPKSNIFLISLRNTY